MADCAALLNEYNSEIGYIKETLSNIEIPANNPSQYSVNQLQQITANMQFGVTNAEDISSYLRELLSSRGGSSCPELASKAKEWLDLADFTSRRLLDMYPKFNAERLRQEEQVNQANQNNNNSGTGEPGTAGEGTDSTVNEPTDNSLKTTPADTNLDTTQATDPNPLDEVVVTAQRTPDDPALEEVVVTATREPEPDLEEIVPTAKKIDNTNKGAVARTRKQATLRDGVNFKAKKDWRVRLSLGPEATYLYRDETNKLLSPLNATDGILFPYTPTISAQYNANYTPAAVAHSNYTYYNYNNSSVDSITINCEFTAQDTYEANYLLAVIHFLKSVTKMFYGQDEYPKPGTPPPLCYLFGLGQYQFNAHPLAITSFTYTLPNNVDYIRTKGTADTDALDEVQVTARTPEKNKKPFSYNWGTIAQNYIQDRLTSGAARIGNAIGLKLSPGGTLKNPDWMNGGFQSSSLGQAENPTYVPTQITIQIGAVPMPSRFDVSQNFSLNEYANGNLLQGVKNKTAGFW